MIGTVLGALSFSRFSPLVHCPESCGHYTHQAEREEWRLLHHKQESAFINWDDGRWFDGARCCTSRAPMGLSMRGRGSGSKPARYAGNRRVPTRILRVLPQPKMAQLVGHMLRRWNFYNSRGGSLGVTLIWATKGE